MGAALIVLVPLVAFVGGVLVGRGATPTDPEIVRLREHARLSALASKAYRKGHPGEANVYTEAAGRLMERKEIEP